MTSASNAEVIKTYIFHPKEWKFGLLVLLIVGYARLFPFTSAGRSRGNDLFDDSYSEYHVQHMVTDEYCKADVRILCGDPRKLKGGCTYMYGDSLSTFWGIAPSIKDCPLATKFASLGRWHPVDGSKYPQLKDCDDCDDRILIVRVVWYSVLLMWQEAEKYFQMAKFPEIPSQQSMEELEGMIRFRFESMLDLFSSDAAYHAGILPTSKEPWTRKEVLSLMRIALELAQNTQFKTIRIIDEKGYFGYHIPTIALVLDKLVDVDEVEKEAGVEHFIPLHQTAKHSYSLFRHTITNNCMYSHYDDGTLITPLCYQAMQTAPSRITEIRIEEGGEFLGVTHMMLFGANLTCCFVLLLLFNSKQRLEKRMDAGRRRLEQELKDPFLRQCLERKVQHLPEEHRQQFIAKLEAKAARWDSKAAALTLLRSYIRRFRFIVIFSILITTMTYWLLYIFHVSSMSRYLETLFLSIAMLVASYAAPIGNNDEEGRPSEILMGTVDPSTTQALLSSNDQVPTSAA
jgi:hypothetical protein